MVQRLDCKNSESIVCQSQSKSIVIGGIDIKFQGIDITLEKLKEPGRSKITYIKSLSLLFKMVNTKLQTFLKY